jgi:nicotinamide-nucleotide amidase
MVEQHVLELIRDYGGLHRASQITRLRLFGITESGLQDIVNQVFPDWPIEVDLGFRVQLPVIEVKLTTIGREHDTLNETWTVKFRKHFSDYIIGTDSTRLSQALNLALLEGNKRITVAESCTGGLIASKITAEAGSSDVFEAGFVVYSNRIKTAILGVESKFIEQYGAVSEQVVQAMAAGALAASNADMGLAISGIAGPSGGTDKKPVGTVWVAWGTAESIQARRFFLPIPRLAFQRTAAAIAMDLVRRELLSLPTDIDYFSELKRNPRKTKV